ncbi:HXXEE domain-containing protein [Konateibacter massiliensis]|uniref:HXXEE domain-containing protein n=1 Tax=Konateibacter massiliensis TaxID=2002841 RepID=UPI000C15DCD5|nr:HXXEE domain-containing protein [Konateibacter massiliensis]
MRLFCRHWYNIGLMVAIGAVAYLAIFWGQLDMLVRLQLMSFATILIHQFEEYGFPGGEPAIMNIVLQNSKIPDRYPLNQFSAMLTNVSAAYTCYLLPVFFPNIIWLGLMPMLFGFSQFIVHVIITNKKMKSLYNPGLGAVVLLHYPIGIYYIYYIVSNDLVKSSDWIIAIIYTIAIAVLLVGGLTYKIMPNKNTKYIFDKVEMGRFHVKEKRDRLIK